MDDNNDKKTLVEQVVDLLHQDFLSRAFKASEKLPKSHADQIIAQRRAFLDQYRETMITLYDKHLTTAQLQALMDFHDSDMGRSIKEAQKRLHGELHEIQQQRTEERNRKQPKPGGAVIGVINKNTDFFNPDDRFNMPPLFDGMTLTDIQPAELDQVLTLWEDSVRATHHFLTDKEILVLRPLVKRQALPNLRLKGMRARASELLGFIGVSGDSVEALFVAPKAFGQGIGRRLLAWAENECGTCKVDVNEQNPRAVRFYINLGYQVCGRSPLDGQGKPFPILHLRKG